MFKFFSNKSEKERLNVKYRKLLEEAHKLSTTNRAQSDQKMAEANEVLKKIEKLS